MKNSAPGKFYKQSVQSIAYFHQKNVFILTNKRKIQDKTFYWLKNTRKNKYFNKRFQRPELFAILNNSK